MTPALEAALAAQKKRPVREPETIRRLREIKPGEEVRYYSGDIRHLMSKTPAAYHDLVERVIDYAQGLKLADRVTLIERSHIVNRTHGGALVVTDYIAVGKARGRDL